jgi:hypothetical protein
MQRDYYPNSRKMTALAPPRKRFPTLWSISFPQPPDEAKVPPPLEPALPCPQNKRLPTTAATPSTKSTKSTQSTYSPHTFTSPSAIRFAISYSVQLPTDYRHTGY